MDVRRGHWTPDEDAVIQNAMLYGDHVRWTDIAKGLGGARSSKQCRDRWSNHLNPALKKTRWTDEEDAILINAQAALGNTWTRIAAELPGRSENEVKNRWYATLQKKLSRKRKIQGVDHLLSYNCVCKDSCPHSVDELTAMLHEADQIVLHGVYKNAASAYDVSYQALGKEYIVSQRLMYPHHNADINYRISDASSSIGESETTTNSGGTQFIASLLLASTPPSEVEDGHQLPNRTSTVRGSTSNSNQEKQVELFRQQQVIPTTSTSSVTNPAEEDATTSSAEQELSRPSVNQHQAHPDGKSNLHNGDNSGGNNTTMMSRNSSPVSFLAGFSTNPSPSWYNYQNQPDSRPMTPMEQK